MPLDDILTATSVNPKNQSKVQNETAQLCKVSNEILIKDSVLSCTTQLSIAFAILSPPKFHAPVLLQSPPKINIQRKLIFPTNQTQEFIFNDKLSHDVFYQFL